jgi:PAS domain S-box-containing protein
MNTLHPSIMNKVKNLESLYPRDIVVVYDTHGRYQYVSSNREQIMGYTPDETYGRHYQDFVAPDYLSHVNLTWTDTSLTGESIDSTVLLIKKSGELARFRTTAVVATEAISNDEYIIVKSQLVADELND